MGDYIAIDLKSFYASVECVERGLDPLKAMLVVADPTRTEKTICLAVSPALKAYGIPGRARLFEVLAKVNAINKNRSTGKLEFITAPPRMALYMEYSSRIFDIYLKYVAAEDMHVYSVDEVFIDATQYLKTYGMTAHELALTMIRDVLKTTGITATAGIGTNLYLAKIAMDIEAKHMEADEDGVRIAELNERSYRENLWNHTPITDFWRVGGGIAKKLAAYQIYTMGDIARCSIGSETDIWNEELLYKLFGVNAELLIDHAWGWEPCTMDKIKSYKAEGHSLGSGQVLKEPYDHEKTAIIVREMTELLVLDLVDKKLVTDQVLLDIGYDADNLKNEEVLDRYRDSLKIDRYGRYVPAPAHGSANLGRFTSSGKLIVDAMMELYESITDKDLLVRRLSVTANHVQYEKDMEKQYEQLDLFSMLEPEKAVDEEALRKERALQEAELKIQKKYGKNAILKGVNLKEGAMTIERNGQIGGHKA
ncbi:MAG: DNA methylase [Lachnospiraceae bacterium]|nr:DNA methylase [Lachnospiraceae bacterium]